MTSSTMFQHFDNLKTEGHMQMTAYGVAQHMRMCKIKAMPHAIRCGVAGYRERAREGHPSHNVQRADEQA